MKPDHFDFFFDIASGYSYLASSQVQPLAQRTGVRARWRPFLLGAAFKETGNDTPARIPAKAAWLVRDMALWARQYGMPLMFPSRFPFNSVTALRLLVAAGRMHGDDAIPRLAHPLFEAAWGLDQDINDATVLARCATQAGFDAAALAAAVGTPETKDALRANTEEAVRRGVFGAPAFFVGDELFWGNDRLHFVEQALSEG
jgi:2-hydroxychromene-2-carboxylate isomerase